METKTAIKTMKKKKKLASCQLCNLISTANSDTTCQGYQHLQGETALKTITEEPSYEEKKKNKQPQKYCV